MKKTIILFEFHGAGKNEPWPLENLPSNGDVITIDDTTAVVKYVTYKLYPKDKSCLILIHTNKIVKQK